MPYILSFFIYIYYIASRKKESLIKAFFLSVEAFEAVVAHKRVIVSTTVVSLCPIRVNQIFNIIMSSLW